MSSIRLLAAGLDPLELDAWDDDTITVSVEVSAPEVREVVSSRPGVDGTDDTTALLGARVATVALAITETGRSRQDVLDRLGPYVHPRQRVTLEVSTTPGAPPRRLNCRPVPPSMEWARPGASQIALSFQTVGSPYWLGEERVQNLIPDGPTLGLKVPFVVPFLLPLTSNRVALIHNAGTDDAVWRVEVTGPCTFPRIRNEATNQEVAFTGLTVLAGQTLVVDSSERSAWIDGQRRSPDYTRTAWWSIPPGDTPVRVRVDTSSAPAAAVLTHSDTYLL